MDAQIITFGGILKRERTNQKLSLRQLSEMSDIEASYINRLEKGNRDNPGFSTVCALANALNLNRNEILQSFGYDRLGSEQSYVTSQLEHLIGSYITENNNSNGYLPKIISLLEELRSQQQQ